MKGVMGKNYHKGRKERLDLRYRLNRRTAEVLRAINSYYNQPNVKILDIGTADGLMLEKIKTNLPKAECIGLEYSQELIDANENNQIKIIQGDAQNLPFNNDLFDIIIATAIIEHIENPDKMLTESLRVLKNDGIIIITTPNPFFEKIATKIGALPEDDHQITFNMEALKNILEKNNFKILETKKFMFSPVGFPFELFFEKIINKLNLDFVFLNQIAIGKK